MKNAFAIIVTAVAISGCAMPSYTAEGLRLERESIQTDIAKAKMALTIMNIELTQCNGKLARALRNTFREASL